MKWISIALTLLSVTTRLSFAQPQSGGTGSASGNTISSAKGDTTFAKAQPEDITNENFPNLIESFDYPNADIAEIVKAISKLTGKNFILEKNVQGKISIIAPSQITVAEAYKAFLTALAMNGFTVVPSGNFLKIRSIQNASKENVDTYSGNYFPNSDQMITRIIKLKYISAVEVRDTLRPIINQSGDITPYAPTNSLIVTDLGSNVERISNIINQLDVPGFEEKLVAIPIKYARSKDIADLIDQIINKGDKKGNQFNAGIPRFRSGGAAGSASSTGAANYSLVIPDARTNAIIVVGNDAGIERIRGLVEKLDYRIRPEDGGGVYVYLVRYGEAEKIANVLNGIASESAKSKTQTGTSAPPPGGGIGGAPAAPTQAVFGGDVKVAADKDNNSLIVTASKQDYEMVRTILSKIDIPRDQVYVKAIIMEMNADATNNWGINYYKFIDGTNGAGRAGFASESLDGLVSPAKDSGLTLGFGNKDIIEIEVGDKKFNVPSLFGLIRFLKKNAGGNILSTPQITALDNEEAMIEVGENVPVSANSTSTATATAANIERKDLTLKLKLTPYISPDTDSVRMKIDQKIEQLSKTSVGAKQLAESAVAYSTRTIQTNVVVNSNDTAVLGGLMEDKESEEVVKVPVLGDIPIIGWLFKGKTTEKVKKNLLIFITPKIIRNSQDNSDLVNAKLNERVDFIQQNMKGRDPHGSEIDKMPRRALIQEESQEYIEPGADVVPQEDLPSSTSETAPTTPEAKTVPPGDYEEGE
jgi:general secretion pathway protein D